MRSQLRCLSLAATIIGAWAGSALAAERTDLLGLERTWHGCVREAYDRQPDERSRSVRDRRALDACKVHENAYVAALMATRPEGGDELLHGWAKTWAAYVAVVVDPVAAWIEALRR